MYFAHSSAPSPSMIRAVQIKSENTGNQLGLFSRVFTKFTTEMGTLFDEQRLGSRLGTIPVFTVRKSGKSLEVNYRKNQRGSRLGSLQLTNHQKAGEPKTIIQVGYLPSGELWLEEWVSHSHVGASLAVAKALSALRDFVCHDRDNERTGVKLSVRKDRLPALIQYIRSDVPERSLPFVLINPGSGSGLIDSRVLASSLAGWARVAQLPEQYDWDLAVAHTCLTGTIRLYSPNYKDSDSDTRHPQWKASSFHDKDALISTILSAVGRRVGALKWNNQLLSPFERAKSKEPIIRAVARPAERYGGRRDRWSSKEVTRVKAKRGTTRPWDFCPHGVDKRNKCRICDPKGYDDEYGIA